MVPSVKRVPPQISPLLGTVEASYQVSRASKPCRRSVGGAPVTFFSGYRKADLEPTQRGSALLPIGVVLCSPSCRRQVISKQELHFSLWVGLQNAPARDACNERYCSYKRKHPHPGRA